MSLKVLIADPDWRFGQLATSYFESRAHHVVCEPSHEAAVATARHWCPDLVIVSEELAETGMIEEFYALAPRPAVLLVGWMDRYDRVWRAWQRGGDELLMKPIFNDEELQLAVVAALESATTGQRKRQTVEIA
jgi:DNA-binding response OmpR family regulator